MHIELAEFLRCPEHHEGDPYCVLVPDVMVGRHVRSGVVACPVCQREYPIAEGAVEFAPPPPVTDRGTSLPPADVVGALLGLASPGGHVVLVGTAARLAPSLVERLPGVHLVAINPPADIEALPILSVVRHPRCLPLRAAMARGVVVGAEWCQAPWLDEARRVVLPGLRIVALREDAAVAGVEELAVGRGMWVGKKH